MPTFRKKPVVIEAEQFHADQRPWPDGVRVTHRSDEEGALSPRAVIDTLEGPHFVSEGDWIITGVKGERYPCKPDIFEMTYEPA